MKKIIASMLCVSMIGCAAGPQIAVDPKSIKDSAKYEGDMSECTAVATSYDLGSSTAKSAVAGAAVGGVAVAGIATAIAGAVFLPAIPFIVAGAAAGGGLSGGLSKQKETAAREKILAECMTERGYRAYTSN